MTTTIPRDTDGKIIDFLDSNTRLAPTPEELVRQRMLRILHDEYRYPKKVMAREVAIQRGSKEVVGAKGRAIRADIVVYNNAAARNARDQGRVRFIVECKAPDQEGGHNQLVSYIFLTSADGGVWFNGSGDDSEVAYFRRTRDNKLIDWVGLPRPKESWDALGRRSKDDLARPVNIKGLLRRCHNKLHARGAASDEEDLTLDMVRILMAKAIDEMADGDLPQFYCTPEEYQNDSGRAEAGSRLRGLFERAKTLHPGVFRAEERITVDNRAICDVVGELQSFRLLSDDTLSAEWDVMGHAYEEYTAVSLKRKRGQFFTNRLVINLLVQIVAPRYDDVVLDPAGGSAGFLSGALRNLRQRVTSSAVGLRPEIARKRIETFRQRLHMVEISHRLVKVAKTAMILHGDGHVGMTQGDSLGAINKLDSALLAACGPGKPTVILTNPPFAGVGDGRITDARVLERFECGRRWSDRDGKYRPTDDLLAEGAPPEMLFFERCVSWLAPGGRLGIVVPKSFLDTATYRPAREILFRDCRLLAVVNCHKHTFQPYTGVRTALLVVERRQIEDEAQQAPVFMAISRAVGQDSEGVPVMQRDATGAITELLDEDLQLIATSWFAHRDGSLKPSEYRFSIGIGALDASLNINPQAHRPSLNATIKAIEALDDSPSWSVCRLDELADGTDVFKGPRFKSENLLVDADRADEPDVEPYYTPSAILQERRDAAKHLDIRRASTSQKNKIAAIRVRRGDIVVTRSGTIGRIAMITSMFDGAIVSDDLIRVRVRDERLRLYLWAYLESKPAQDQIMRNEYGAIQQHLEPAHVRSLLVPVPADQAQLDVIVVARRRMLQAKEQLIESGDHSDQQIHSLLGFLQN